jgi:hypothetical protein
MSRRDDLIAHARSTASGDSHPYSGDHDVQVFDDAEILPTDDGSGTWVQAWVWVPADAVTPAGLSECCGWALHRCETGDPGCWHCDKCGNVEIEPGLCHFVKGKDKNSD